MAGKDKSGNEERPDHDAGRPVGHMRGIIEKPLPHRAGEDSYNMLPALIGRDTGPIHDVSIFHSGGGVFAIRKGDWKLVYSLIGDGLFNLKDDISETTDLRDNHPDLVKELTEEHHKWRSRNKPSRVTDDTRRAHIWELRFREDMGSASKNWFKEIGAQK